MAHPFQSDPQAIYAQSFATIRAEADLSTFAPDEREVAVRIIHACGMVEIASELAFSKRAVAAGRAALKKGAPIICDAQMVAHGIIAHRLGPQTEIVCRLKTECASQFAQEHRSTRSAGGIECVKDRMEGAIVAIGNAPTALFHLLNRLQQGWPRPALVLGFPVGFVGAAESKKALIENRLGIEFVALKGRKGGSAMAAAAVNALVFGTGEEKAQ